MTYVGIDLAWSGRARTGLAVLDVSGRLIGSSSCVTDDEIDEWLAQNAAFPTVIAVDAPLVVPNDTGMRLCERLIGSAYGRYDASCHASNRGQKWHNPPRAEVLATRQGWRVNPSESSRVSPTCIEVYPHAALVGLFKLGRILSYKKGDVALRREGLLRLLALLEGVDVLQLDTSTRWGEIRAAVVAAQRSMHLNAVEDEVDAIVCAYVAWLWHHDAASLQVFGTVETGYIVAPLPPTHAAAPRQPKHVDAPSRAVFDAAEWTARIRAFAEEREWQQFHTPKNLAMALSVEASELVEIFQWLTPEESAAVMSTERGQAVRDEVADVMTYLLRFADVLDIDLDAAMTAKTESSAERYTVEHSKGSAAKR